MLKMLKIDQVHLRTVMLCMPKTSKMGKEHIHTFLLKKPYISAFQNFFRIENSLNIKEVMSKNMLVCILSL